MTDGRTSRSERLRDIDRLASTWHEHGRDDPLWAILTEPGKRGGRWDVSGLFATGRADVAELIARLRQLGVEPRLE
jgi:hypothetical protein